MLRKCNINQLVELVLVGQTTVTWKGNFVHQQWHSTWKSINLNYCLQNGFHWHPIINPPKEQWASDNKFTSRCESLEVQVLLMPLHCIFCMMLLLGYILLASLTWGSLYCLISTLLVSQELRNVKVVPPEWTVVAFGRAHSASAITKTQKTCQVFKLKNT